MNETRSNKMNDYFEVDLGEPILPDGMHVNVQIHKDKHLFEEDLKKLKALVTTLIDIGN